MKEKARQTTDSAKEAAHAASVKHAGNDRLGLDRLIFFSDAVFAIAITLLALDIQLPPTDGDDISSAEMWRMLASLTPDFSAYITSFLVIALFWLGHHSKFRSIVRYDPAMLWLNILLLMIVAFIPFPTRVMSDYDNSASTIFYAAVVAAAGLVTATINFYAAHNNRLIDPDSPMVEHVKKPWRLLAMPVVFLLSIPLAFYDTNLARTFWLVLIPVSLL
jgi:uncharacterized membrane protein